MQIKLYKYKLEQLGNITNDFIRYLWACENSTIFR